MKQLEISRLMDEYQDNEFFPQGGESANVQTVKEQVLAKAAPAKGRRRPLKMALLAAALAAGAVLCMAAGIPGTAYRTLTGIITLERTEDGHKSAAFEPDNDEPFDFQNDPVQLENGRIFFVLDGQRTDITDLIDGETPYIYDDSNLSAGTFHYLIVGGTPDRYGWLEWFEGPQPLDWRRDDRLIAAEMEDVTWAAHVVKMVDTIGKTKIAGNGSGVGQYGFSKDLQSQWLETALDTLGILVDPDEASTPLRPGIYFVD